MSLKRNRTTTELQSKGLSPASALRHEALEICRLAGWLPQCIAIGRFQAGVPEIYEELRCLQKASAVDVSEALIDCCQKYQLWTSLFEDVEARIWFLRGERERAESRWNGLLHHPNEQLSAIAQKALDAVALKVDSGEMLATEVIQALDRGHSAAIDEMLLKAILEVKDLEDQTFRNILEAKAMSKPMPEQYPWDRSLYIDQVLLELFDQQLSEWIECYGG